MGADRSLDAVRSSTACAESDSVRARTVIEVRRYVITRGE
jgi:hypothetical protein